MSTLRIFWRFDSWTYERKCNSIIKITVQTEFVFKNSLTQRTTELILIKLCLCCNPNIVTTQIEQRK